jgi:hypothetical protein
MVKEVAQELKKEFAKGNLKPSQLKKSKSTSDLPKNIQPTEPLRRKSIDPVITSESLTKQLQTAQDQISILELKIDTQERELTELSNLQDENNHLKEQAKTKQQQMEQLTQQLEETNSKLALVQAELDQSLEARLQGLKD